MTFSVSGDSRLPQSYKQYSCVNAKNWSIPRIGSHSIKRAIKCTWLNAKRTAVNYTEGKANTHKLSRWHSTETLPCQARTLQFIYSCSQWPLFKWWGGAHPRQRGTTVWVGSEGGHLCKKEMTFSKPTWGLRVDTVLTQFSMLCHSALFYD